MPLLLPKLPPLPFSLRSAKSTSAKGRHGGLEGCERDQEPRRRPRIRRPFSKSPKLGDGDEGGKAGQKPLVEEIGSGGAPPLPATLLRQQTTPALTAAPGAAATAPALLARLLTPRQDLPAQHIALRQDGVRTMTLRDGSVTTITLGDGQQPSRPTGPPAQFVPTFATTTDPAGTETIAVPMPTGPQPTYTPSDSSSAQNYIGAILGSVVAFLFIVLLIWFCFIRPRLIWQADSDVVYHYDDSASSSDGHSHHRHRPRGRMPGPGQPGGPGGAWAGAARVVLNPAPARFPPRRPGGEPGYRQASAPQMRGTYRQNTQPQMRGVRVYHTQTTTTTG